MSDPQRPHGLQPSRLLHPWDFPGKSSGVGCILHQIVSRLPVANQVFLGSWMADVRQEGRSQRSALQRRHIAHLRQRSCCTPRKPSSWDPGGGKTHRPTWEECTHQTPSSSSPELLGPGKGTKSRPNQVCAFVEYPRT